MKKIAIVAIVLAILINSVSVLAYPLGTCSYCTSPGYLICQNDSVAYSGCPYCSPLGPPYDKTLVSATHHLYCTNSSCGAVYYYGTHKCYCMNPGCFDPIVCDY